MEKTMKTVKGIAKNVKSKAVRVAIGAKKTIAKKIDVGFYVQYHGKEFFQQKVQEEFYDEWLKSHKISEIKTLDIYLKVEENIAYCLVNGQININVRLS